MLNTILLQSTTPDLLHLAMSEVTGSTQPNGSGIDHLKQETAINGLGEKAKCSKSIIEPKTALRNLVKRLPLDWICLSVVLLIVWGLLLLPIIYFHTEIVSLLSS